MYMRVNDDFELKAYIKLFDVAYGTELNQNESCFYFKISSLFIMT